MTIDPIVLANGMKVSVEFPPRLPHVCPAPPPPQPGGVTVPVQGSLTAEQLAHIVATVTAKVVEELGGQPGNVDWSHIDNVPATFPPTAHRHNASDIDDLPSGGGGAGIDDTTIGTDTTWSSQKTSDELAGKADDKFLVMDAETGEMQENGLPLAEGVAMSLTYLPYYLAAFSEFADSTGITISAALPEFTEPGQLYAVRDTDTGIVTWHMPSIPA